MNHLVTWDYLRRKRWILGALLLGHLGLSTVGWHTKDATFVGIFSIFGGAFLLMTDQMQAGPGGPRTLLSLPLTSRELARSWRFVGLELPAVVFLLVTLLGALLASLLGIDKELTFDRLVLHGVVQTLLLGLTFFAITGMPMGGQAQQQDVAQMVKGAFFGLLLGFAFPAMMFLMQWFPERLADLGPVHLLVFSLLGFASIAGWMGAENLVINRLRRMNTGGDAKRKKAPSVGPADWRKMGGTSYFLFRFAGLCLVLGFFILLMNWYGMSIFLWIQNGSDPGRPARLLPAGQMAPILAMILVMQIMGQLKTLRSLPLSRAGLTSLILLCPIGLSLLFGILALFLAKGLHGIEPDWIQIPAIFVGSVLLCFGVPLLLRFGFRLRGFVPLIVVLIASQSLFFGSTMVGGKLLGGSLLPALLTAAVVALPILWWLTWRLLGSEHPWREGAMRMPMQAEG